MKKVFNNDQVCHVFVNQSQEEGRGNNIFFQGDEIFSYGEHYLMGKIFDVKGQKVILVNDDVYSISTAKHRHKLFSALHGREDFKVFSVPFPRSLEIEENEAALSNVLVNLIDDALNVRVIKPYMSESGSFEFMFERIYAALVELNDFRALIGLKALEVPSLFLDAITESHAKAWESYRARNTPEALAKKEEEGKKRDAQKQAKEAKDLEEKITLFRLGHYVRLPNLPFDLLRVSGNEVETSRGARLPLDQALKMLESIKAGRFNVGDRVGHFSLERVEEAAG